MAQTLFINKPEGQKEVSIHRAFWDASGRKLYLHTNGKYAYKDETPIKSVSEFDIIGNPFQREAAIRWWKYAGKAESETYYAEKLEKEKARLGDFQSGNSAAKPEIDIISYTRKNTTGRGMVSNPHTWREWFTTRPDWWGQAEVVAFKDFTYTMTLLGREGELVQPAPAEA